jgi:hypothetical protein
MPQEQNTIIYILTALSGAEIVDVAARLEAASFEPVFDQSLVVQAVDLLVPGTLKNEAWVIIADPSMRENNRLVAAAGRLLGLKSVDSSLIVFTALVDPGRAKSWLSSSPELTVSLFDLGEIVPSAISFIARKMGERSARTAEKREVLENVDRSLDKHIAPILLSLGAQERHLWWAAVGFYSTALIALAAGLYLAALRSHQLHVSPPKSWFDIVGATVSGLIVIGMLTAVARLAFILGRSFMMESLTNGDRAHAISFGRFYLQAFGEKADWSEIKEAFQHWNIDRGSSFAAQTATDIDPIVLQVATEVVKSVVNKTK